MADNITVTDNKITVEVTRDFLFEACALVYGRWSKEYDLLKKVKEEKNDGSKDWKLFHEERLKRHTEQERVWRIRSNEAAALSALLRK